MSYLYFRIFPLVILKMARELYLRNYYFEMYEQQVYPCIHNIILNNLTDYSINIENGSPICFLYEAPIVQCIAPLSLP